MSPIKIVERLVDEGFTPHEIRLALGDAFSERLKLSRDEQFYCDVVQPGFLAVSNTNQRTQHAQNLYTIDDVFCEQECKKIHKLSLKGMQPSEIAAKQDGKLLNFRTSRTCYLYQADDPFVDEIESRPWDLVSPKVGGAEVVQAQHYRKGQQFKPHHDYFAPGTASYRKMGKAGDSEPRLAWFTLPCRRKVVKRFSLSKMSIWCQSAVKLSSG